MVQGFAAAVFSEVVRGENRNVSGGGVLQEEPEVRRITVEPSRAVVAAERAAASEASDPLLEANGVPLESSEDDDDDDLASSVPDE